MVLNIRKKNHFLNLFSGGFPIIFVFLIFSCLPFERITKVRTDSAGNPTSNSCIVNGTIIDIGDEGIIQYGHCWSVNPNPTISNDKTELGARVAPGSYVSNLMDLASNQKYYVTAYAIDNKGEHYYGNEINFTTLAIPIPAAPTNLSAVAESSSQINLSWTDNSGNEAGFKIERSLDSIRWDVIATVEMNQTTFQNTGLVTSGPYFYRIRSFNDAGDSDPSNPAKATTCIKPDVRTDGIVNFGTTIVTLAGHVNSPYNPATVTFEYGTDLEFDSSVTAQGSPIITDFESYQEVIAEVTGLSPNTTYYFRVSAVNCGGNAVGDTLSFITDPYEVYDANDNVYHVVRIGTQLWMKENLKATLTMDGSGPVPLITDGTEWSNLTSSGYCWYNNDERYKDIYGALYNWYAVNNEELCPIDMHIATEGDWRILTNYLGGEIVAGGKMKETGFDHWQDPNTDATNISGFTALPGGHRTNFGIYSEIKLGGYWWTSSPDSDADAWMRAVTYDGSGLLRFYNSKNYGYSVRCIRDY
jgi:uncharacterized protein (TIGR02145 family)